jgi:hypothetical protein
MSLTTLTISFTNFAHKVRCQIEMNDFDKAFANDAAVCFNVSFDINDYLECYACLLYT